MEWGPPDELSPRLPIRSDDSIGGQPDIERTLRGTPDKRPVRTEWLKLLF